MTAAFQAPKNKFCLRTILERSFHRCFVCLWHWVVVGLEYTLSHLKQHAELCEAVFHSES